MRILCLLAVAAASVSALDWHDAGREPIFVAGGATVLNNEGRKASGDVGAALTLGALLPVEAAYGPPGIDLDWRSVQGSQGSLNHVDLMAVMRHTVDRTGVFLGVGAGLGYARYQPADNPPKPQYVGEAAQAVGPCAKAMAGYANGPMFFEAAYIFPAPLAGLRTDGLSIMVGFRFGSGWYRP